MVLTVGTDTYATLAEADAYALARAWTGWAAATEAVREQALRDAAGYLSTSYRWKGRLADMDQALSWPRKNVIDHEGRDIANTVVPEAVKSAQIELAYKAISATLVTDDAQGDVSQVRAGEVSVTFAHGQRVTEAERLRSIDRLLLGLYEAREGGGKITRSMVKA